MFATKSARCKANRLERSKALEDGCLPWVMISGAMRITQVFRYHGFSISKPVACFGGRCESDFRAFRLISCWRTRAASPAPLLPTPPLCDRVTGSPCPHCSFPGCRFQAAESQRRRAFSPLETSSRSAARPAVTKTSLYYPSGIYLFAQLLLQQ